MSRERDKSRIELFNNCQEAVKFIRGLTREDREDLASELFIYADGKDLRIPDLQTKARWMIIDKWRREHGCIDADPQENNDGLGTLAEWEWDALMEMIEGDSTLIAIVEGLAMGQSTQEIAKTLGMNYDASRQKIARFKHKIKNLEKKS